MIKLCESEFTGFENLQNLDYDKEVDFYTEQVAYAILKIG